MLNPFLTPTVRVPWSRLTSDRVLEAVQEGVRLGEKALAEIAALPPEARSVASVLLAFERATEPLDFAWTLINHLDSVDNSPALRDAIREALPLVSGFYARVRLDARLWDALRGVAESPEGQALTGVHRRFMDETLADFRESGAELPDDGKRRLEALEGELASITQTFSENVLDAMNQFELLIDDPARLDGLPESARAAALALARAKGLGTPERPVWRFTLHMPSYLPVMKFSADEPLRRALWEAMGAVGSVTPHDNTPLIGQILRLRHEKATLLGAAHFPDHILHRRMARRGEVALGFVNGLHERVKGAFLADVAELAAFKAELLGQPGVALEPWDVTFYSERLRQARYELDEEALRPYFPLDGVLNGLFALVERLFGLRVTPRETCCPRAGGPSVPGAVETWHPEVRYFELHDQNGRLLGAFYTDWHPRESKQGGAWMGTLYTAEAAPPGQRGPHVGLIAGNLTAPTDGGPALLTHREVETVAHELGHLLHHLTSDVEVRSFSGANVAWDFVELPSQIMENWCWQRAGLDLIARHHETGEALPQPLFDRLVAAHNFQAGINFMAQLAHGKLDLELHLRGRDWAPEELDERLRELLDGWRVPTQTDAGFIVRRFTHLFAHPTGYAAAYYSYKWAEVLDADAFTRFRDEGVLSPVVGREYLERVLSRGNSAPPEQLFRDFMGRDPDPDALLRRCGLSA
ncbi:MAG: hypothetical protein RIT28_4224 [Pseudomonadota bacterium]|jgi:oligopeptidase A